MWLRDRVAQEIGRTPAALNHLRKRGLFPAPDGYEGRRPWWRPGSVQAWLESQQLPAGAVSKLSGIARLLGVSERRLQTIGLPPADGQFRSDPWWHPATMLSWAQTAFNDELLTAEEFRERLGCADGEWHELRPQAPAPFLANPDRWWPAQVNPWIAARGRELRADPAVLFLGDVPAVSGLAPDSVRRYRWAGRMPSPDGYHRSRPWWNRDTIQQWDQVRNRDHAPFPPRFRPEV